MATGRRTYHPMEVDMTGACRLAIFNTCCSDKWQSASMGQACFIRASQYGHTVIEQCWPVMVAEPDVWRPPPLGWNCMFLGAKQGGGSSGGISLAWCCVRIAYLQTSLHRYVLPGQHDLDMSRCTPMEKLVATCNYLHRLRFSQLLLMVFGYFFITKKLKQGLACYIWLERSSCLEYVLI